MPIKANHFTHLDRNIEYNTLYFDRDACYSMQGDEQHRYLVDENLLGF